MVPTVLCNVDSISDVVILNDNPNEPLLHNSVIQNTPKVSWIMVNYDCKIFLCVQTWCGMLCSTRGISIMLSKFYVGITKMLFLTLMQQI